MKKQQVDTYIEMTLPYPDARIASVRTGPRGPCKYTVKGGNAISDSIIESLVPHIHAAFAVKLQEYWCCLSSGQHLRGT
jgi:hypothetical protein